MEGSRQAFTLLDGGRPVAVDVSLDAGRVRLTAEALEAALGWSLTPEGLCREGLCVPVPPGTPLAGEEGVDLAALAAVLDRPLVVDLAERAAALGASARERGATISSLRAPDFTLPDLGGRLHSLSEQRGRKVLLVAWASW